MPIAASAIVEAKRLSLSRKRSAAASRAHSWPSCTATPRNTRTSSASGDAGSAAQSSSAPIGDPPAVTGTTSVELPPFGRGLGIRRIGEPHGVRLEPSGRRRAFGERRVRHSRRRGAHRNAAPLLSSSMRQYDRARETPGLARDAAGPTASPPRGPRLRRGPQQRDFEREQPFHARETASSLLLRVILGSDCEQSARHGGSPAATRLRTAFRALPRGAAFFTPIRGLSLTRPQQNSGPGSQLRRLRASHSATLRA